MTKAFIHHDIPVLERIDGRPEGRLYKTPDGNLYPSVTTVLGATSDHTWLDEWKAKVGEDAAAKISKQAADRGTLIHSRCEDFLLGRSIEFTKYQQTQKEMFEYLLPVLNDVDNIHCMETTLYSDKLKVAGTVDLIAEYKGKLRIIDWKNSRRYKTEEEITGYFMQMSAYAFMFWERTGIPVKDLLVAMTVEDYGLLLFEKRVEDYMHLFIEARKKFNQISS